MRMSYWSSDGCSSDLWSAIIGGRLISGTASPSRGMNAYDERQTRPGLEAKAFLCAARAKLFRGKERRSTENVLIVPASRRLPPVEEPISCEREIVRFFFENSRAAKRPRTTSRNRNTALKGKSESVSED